MPRYAYECEKCEAVITLNHSPDECGESRDCDRCGSKKTMVNILTIPTIVQSSDIGKVTNKHIEEIRKDLNEMKKELEKNRK